MKGIKCKLGIHKWSYVHKYVTRECTCCGKTQITVNVDGEPGEILMSDTGELIAPRSAGDKWVDV